MYWEGTNINKHNFKFSILLLILDELLLRTLHEDLLTLKNFGYLFSANSWKLCNSENIAQNNISEKKCYILRCQCIYESAILTVEIINSAAHVMAHRKEDIHTGSWINWREWTQSGPGFRFTQINRCFSHLPGTHTWHTHWKCQTEAFHKLRSKSSKG